MIENYHCTGRRWGIKCWKRIVWEAATVPPAGSDFKGGREIQQKAPGGFFRGRAEGFLVFRTHGSSDKGNGFVCVSDCGILLRSGGVSCGERH